MKKDNKKSLKLIVDTYDEFIDILKLIEETNLYNKEDYSVSINNSKNILTIKYDYTQKQIDFYIANGVFPGATETRTNSYSGPLGFGGSISTTRPIRNKNTAYNDGLSNWEKEQLAKMPKEKWKNLSKAQRLMFPIELRTLYNQHYK